MELSESSIYKEAQENPGFVIVGDRVTGFLKEMGEIPIWTTDCDEAMRFPFSQASFAEATIRRLASMGRPCSLQYYWIARKMG